MSKYTVHLNGKDIEQYEKLSHHQTMELLQLYQQNHDLKIKEKLVLSNLKLVLSLVQKYQQRVNHLDDLFQVGVIGLIKAIDHFDTSLEVRFSTYAVPLILGEIKRYLRESSPMHIPRSLRDIAYKALVINEDYMKKHHREASFQELSCQLKINEYVLVEALSSTQNVSSLSQEVQNDGNGPIDLESQIPDRHNAIDEIQRTIDLQKAMHCLDQKELHIIKERYFEGFTQSEIAKDLMISQAQVSRIEKQALSHLKKYMLG